MATTPTLARLALFCLALAASIAAPAKAQSLYGPGGLFLHPTADVPPKGKLTPGFLLLPQHDPVANDTRTWITGSLDYGLTDDLEVGLSFVKVTGWDRDPSFGGFFKYRLLRETERGPALAVGFTGLTAGDVNTQAAFLALRKQLGNLHGRPIVGHIGAQYVAEEDGQSRHEFRPYGGIEFGLSSRLSFIAEARPRGNREFGTPLALTLAYQATERMRFAVTWANNGLSDTPRFGFGAGYSLGARR